MLNASTSGLVLIASVCRASVLLSEADLIEILRSPSETEGTNPNVSCEEHSISISNHENIPTPVTQKSEVVGREDGMKEMVEKLATTYLFDNGIRGESLLGCQAC
jgi:hypothetical protein